MEPIDILKEAQSIKEIWVPKDLVRFSGIAIRIARLRGSYHWHVHKNEDELFYVLSGTVEIDTDKGTIRITPGQAYLVKAGVRHRSRADYGDALVLLVEPERTITTGEPWVPSEVK